LLQHSSVHKPVKTDEATFVDQEESQ